ncbi:uncharacterized protein LOC113760595 [Coffea eugenioides]|uniref:uncharacterized protein LOC113760595 n=1 Tax=Coffea eugenioides TaxID=49369 RepID=UPI000F60EC6F|nr:uncharacterized protein LOC113760595 [Coffea eugenioides]
MFKMEKIYLITWLNIFNRKQEVEQYQRKIQLKFQRMLDCSLEESTTPTIVFAEWEQNLCLRNDKKEFPSKPEFVADHSLEEGVILVFLPPSSNSFAAVVFNKKELKICIYGIIKFVI